MKTKNCQQTTRSWGRGMKLFFLITFRTTLPMAHWFWTSDFQNCETMLKSLRATLFNLKWSTQNLHLQLHYFPEIYTQLCIWISQLHLIFNSWLLHPHHNLTPHSLSQLFISYSNVEVKIWDSTFPKTWRSPSGCNCKIYSHKNHV